jgi:hypothetical protein
MDLHGLLDEYRKTLLIKQARPIRLIHVIRVPKKAE